MKKEKQHSIHNRTRNTTTKRRNSRKRWKTNELISKIKDYYSKEGQIPKEILSALLKIWKKHNFPPYKTKHLQPTFFKHKPKLK